MTKLKSWGQSLLKRFGLPVSTSTSGAHLMGPTKLETTGPKLTDELEGLVAMVVTECYMGPVSIQSNFARSYAFELGVAASLGFISTETPDGYTRAWRATTAGITFVQGG